MAESVKRKVDQHGRIAIGELLRMSKINPGDWVEITFVSDKITIKPAEKKKPQGVVKAVAGSLRDFPVLVEEMLRIREEEDDRPDTILD